MPGPKSDVSDSGDEEEEDEEKEEFDVVTGNEGIAVESEQWAKLQSVIPAAGPRFSSRA